MCAWVNLRLPNGEESLLRPGDLIGRHWRCTLQIADERVSEAHAMVSIRGGSLRLLGLRGGLAVNGVVVSDPILEPGLVVELAPGLPLQVREVHLPRHSLALEGPDLGPTALSGTMSLHTSGRPRLTQGYTPDADAWLWSDGNGWYCTVGGHTRGPLKPGDDLEVDGWTGRLVEKSLQGGPATVTGFQVSHQPLTVEAWPDIVRIFRGPELLVHVGGMKARLIAELAAVGAPVDWAAVAAALWDDTDDRWALRKRWDTTLRRLRRQLTDAGIRSDFIASDGSGLFSLVMGPDDTVALRD